MCCFQIKNYQHCIIFKVQPATLPKLNLEKKLSKIQPKIKFKCDIFINKKI